MTLDSDFLENAIVKKEDPHVNGPDSPVAHDASGGKRMKMTKPSSENARDPKRRSLKGETVSIAILNRNIPRAL